jgi:outer membrane protein TolC
MPFNIIQVNLLKPMKQLARIFLFLALAVSGPLGALRGAAPAAPFAGTRLEDYLLRAQASNPELVAFEKRYEAAHFRVRQVSSLPDPRLQVTHFVESVQTRTGPQDNAFVLSQTLPWFGKLSTRRAGASAEAEALWFVYQAKQLSLAREVSLGFFEYGYTGKAIDLTAENLRLLEELEPVVEAKVQGGGDLTQLLRLKVEIGKVSDRYKSLHQRREVQSSQLNALLALRADSILPWPDWEAPKVIMPRGDITAIDVEADNPELAVLRRRIISAEARRELARLEQFPDVTLGLNYVELGDAINPTVPGAGVNPWGIMFAVNVPIWSGKYRAARREAEAEQQAIERDLADRTNRLRTQLIANLAGLRDADRRLALFGDELLGLAQQAVDISKTSYESGRTGILEVIDSERSLLELQLLYWRAAADAWQIIVTIQTLANRPILGTFTATTEK